MSARDHFQRIPARLPVLVTDSDHVENYFTAQIGLHGVYVVTELPRPEGHWLHLTLSLPDGQLFEVQGRVARAVNVTMAREQGIPAGMGITFSGLSATASSRWEQLLAQAYQRIAKGEPPVGWGRPSETKTRAVHYQLGVASVEKLNEFAVTALPAKGVFIRTVKLCTPGTPAVICVIHPLSGDEFHLFGVVVSVSKARGGVGVRLRDVSQKTIEEFKRFIVLGIPVVETIDRKVQQGPFSDFDEDLIKTKPRPVAREAVTRLEGEAFEEETETTIEITEDDFDSLEAEGKGAHSEELFFDFEPLVIDVLRSSTSGSVDDGIISMEINELDEEAQHELESIAAEPDDESVVSPSTSETR